MQLAPSGASKEYDMFKKKQVDSPRGVYLALHSSGASCLEVTATVHTSWYRSPKSIRAFPLLSHSKAILSLQRIIIVWSPQTAGTRHSKMCVQGCMRVWNKSVKMCVEVSNAHQNVKCVQMKQEVCVNVCKRKHKGCVNKSVKCV